MKAFALAALLFLPTAFADVTNSGTPVDSYQTPGRPEYQAFLNGLKRDLGLHMMERRNHPSLGDAAKKRLGEMSRFFGRDEKHAVRCMRLSEEPNVEDKFERLEGELTIHTTLVGTNVKKVRASILFPGPSRNWGGELHFLDWDPLEVAPRGMTVLHGQEDSTSLTVSTLEGEEQFFFGMRSVSEYRNSERATDVLLCRTKSEAAFDTTLPPFDKRTD